MARRRDNDPGRMLYMDKVILSLAGFAVFVAWLLYQVGAFDR